MATSLCLCARSPSLPLLVPSVLGLSFSTYLCRFEHNLLVWSELGAGAPIAPLARRRAGDGWVPGHFHPLAYEKFWELVKRKRGEGLRLKHLTTPHPCGMCRTTEQYKTEETRTQVLYDASTTV